MWHCYYYYIIIIAFTVSALSKPFFYLHSKVWNMNVNRNYFIANIHVQTIDMKEYNVTFLLNSFCCVMVVSRVTWPPCSFIHYDENCFFISNNYTFPAFIILCECTSKHTPIISKLSKYITAIIVIIIWKKLANHIVPLKQFSFHIREYTKQFEGLCVSVCVHLSMACHFWCTNTNKLYIFGIKSSVVFNKCDALCTPVIIYII